MTAAASVLSGGLILRPTTAELAAQLEELQRTCFPTLDDAQRFKAPHYRKHVELFPEGQFVVLDHDRVVAATTTVRRHFDFAEVGHTFADVFAGGWLTSHEPDGPWLYGLDIGVHPAYRRRGIGTALYAARHDTVRRLGLKGQITAGIIHDYGTVKHRMSAEEYYRGIVDGSIVDATLSMQLAVGFEPRGLLPGYVNDPGCDNYSVLLVLPADRPVRQG